MEMPVSLQQVITDGLFRNTIDHNIVYANTAFAMMFGYASVDELMTASVKDLYADAGVLSDVIKQIATEEEIRDIRVSYRRKDKTLFWGSLTCKRVGRKGDRFYEGRITDITYVVEAEDKLKSRETDMAKLTTELDRFMYSASHDIRSPLSSILGIVGLMKLDLHGDTAAGYIQMIEASALKLDNFIRGLTRYARNVKEPINEELVDFNLIIADVLKELEDTHVGSADMETQFTVNALCDFYSDLYRVRLILYHVIHNSLEYMDRAKATHFMAVDVQIDREKASIEIFDNGIGIPAMHTDRVFEMFYRASTLSTGSGIGLYIARDAVSKLGGTISIKSQLGVFTTVRIELPNGTRYQQHKNNITGTQE